MGCCKSKQSTSSPTIKLLTTTTPASTNVSKNSPGIVSLDIKLDILAGPPKPISKCQSSINDLKDSKFDKSKNSSEIKQIQPITNIIDSDLFTLSEVNGAMELDQPPSSPIMKFPSKAVSIASANPSQNTKESSSKPTFRKSTKKSIKEFFFGSSDMKELEDIDASHQSLNGSPVSVSRKSLYDSSPMSSSSNSRGSMTNFRSRAELGATSESTKVAPRKSVRHRKSLDLSDETVKQSRKKWLEEEKSKMEDTMAQEWEAIFKDMALGKGKDELTKSELMEGFKKMGKRIDQEMVNKVFVLFDANGDGVVDLTEFMVAMLFLSYRGSAKDNVELAFRLFDTNRSGDISKREFSEMISSIIGTSLPTLLKVNEAELLFKDSLQQEFAAESMNFLDEVKLLKSKYPVTNDQSGELPIAEAKSLINKFILEGAHEQVNVSDRQRNQIKMKLEEAEKSGLAKISWKSILIAESEIISLLEKDKLPKFKRRIRNSTTFADMVWEGMNLDPDDAMSPNEFRNWSDSHPGMFSFLDEMKRVILEEEARKAAALKIQRARRRVVGRRVRYSGMENSLGRVSHLESAVSTHGSIPDLSSNTGV